MFNNMITEEQINRINELAHKSKKEGLSEEEKQEQNKLRQAYIDAIRGNIRSQLDNVDVVNADGSIENLGEMRRNREKEK